MFFCKLHYQLDGQKYLTKMKKSLLSLLAISLAVAGYQNYGDQFDDLNSQIAVLSSEIAGLAKIKGDLASLAVKVSSLNYKVTLAANKIEELARFADNLAATSSNLYFIDYRDNFVKSQDKNNTNTSNTSSCS